MEENKKKKGRPKKVGSLGVRLPGLRVSGEMYERLRAVSRRSGFSQADIQRIGMENFIIDLEKRHPEEQYDVWEEEYCYADEELGDDDDIDF